MRPSWVSRRLGLVEKLGPGLQNDVRAGLVSPTVARDLTRLPRGNQDEVARAIRQGGLTSREASTFVQLFEKTGDRRQQKALLDAPRTAVERAQGGPRPAVWDPRLSPQANRLRRALQVARNGQLRVLRELREHDASRWDEDERRLLGSLLEELRHASEAVLQEVRPPHAQEAIS